MATEMKNCQRCKDTLPLADFGGYAICPKCREKQTAGSHEKLQRDNEYKQKLADADENYLAKEPVKTRPKRTPLNARNLLNATDTPPGYIDRWFNDNRRGGLEAVEAAGWEYVKTDNPDASNDRMVEGRRLPGSVDSKPVGNGVTAYRMRKNLEEYNEDMGESERRAQARERAILAPQEQNSSFYTRSDVPIKVGTSLHEKQIKAIG